MKPYVAIYSTFMQRCVDMIQHDAALQKLPVRFLSLIHISSPPLK